MQLFVMQSSPSSGPNILLSAVFSNALGLYSSLNITGQNSFLYRKESKIMVFHILILSSSTADEKTENS
jgi:hypothetical protein